MSLTSDTELINECQKFKIPLVFIGFKSELDQIDEPKSGFYIINSGGEDGETGIHWVCCMLYKDPRPSARKAFYFNSFGLAPYNSVLKMCKRAGIHDVKFSKLQIQSMWSGWCGFYVVAFGRAMYSKNDSSFEERYKLFIKRFDDYMT